MSSEILTDLEIEIKLHRPLHFGHLHKPAALQLGDEDLVFIFPEKNPLVRQFQDYKLLHVKLHAEHAESGDITVDEIDEPFFDFFLQTIMDAKKSTLSAWGMPIGADILSSGYTAILGRRYDSQLRLGRFVSREHALIQTDETGILFTDLHSTNGTKLKISKVDLSRRPFAIPSQEPLSRDLRQTLYNKFLSVVSSPPQMTNVDTADFSLYPSLVNTNDGPIIEIDVEGAPGACALSPPEDYTHRKIVIKPDADSIVIDDYVVQTHTGTYKTPNCNQNMTETIARDLIAALDRESESTD